MSNAIVPSAQRPALYNLSFSNPPPGQQMEEQDSRNLVRVKPPSSSALYNPVVTSAATSQMIVENEEQRTTEACNNSIDDFYKSIEKLYLISEEIKKNYIACYSIKIDKKTIRFKSISREFGGFTTKGISIKDLDIRTDQEGLTEQFTTTLEKIKNHPLVGKNQDGSAIKKDLNQLSEKDQRIFKYYENSNEDPEQKRFNDLVKIARRLRDITKIEIDDKKSESGSCESFPICCLCIGGH